jgi:predicted  nucleic acid-binding Zn-ribbon protein
METSEMETSEIQKLNSKLKDFDSQLSSLKERIDVKRAEAASAMLEDRDATKLETEAVELQARLGTTQLARQTLEKRLSDANERLAEAKKAEGRARVNVIAEEIAHTGEDLEKSLRQTAAVALKFDGLLKEAEMINKSLGVSLTPLGHWWVAKKDQMPSILDFALGVLQTWKPKKELRKAS